MALGNRYNYGNKRSNFNFQLNFLKQLSGCCDDNPTPSACPPICNAPFGDIIGITSDISPGNGWYLDEKLPILIYIENETATNSSDCSSGIAAYYAPDNISGPYIYNFSTESWDPIIYLISFWDIGTSITVIGTIPSTWYGQVEVSLDGGTTWNPIGSEISSADLAAGIITITINETSFRHRLKVLSSPTCFYYTSARTETE